MAQFPVERARQQAARSLRAGYEYVVQMMKIDSFALGHGFPALVYPASWAYTQTGHPTATAAK